jgi:CBS domain-containing protein
MTSDLITVDPDAPLKEAARRMIEFGVSGLPVTTESGTLIGVITEADFVKTEADRSPNRRRRLLTWFANDKNIRETERLVRDAMTDDVIVLGPEIDHVEAARVMTKAGIKRIPITGDDGELMGVVSRSDIVQVFARADAEIIDEIVNIVMRDVLWIDPRRVRVICEEGNVILSGQTANRSDAELLVTMTRRLDGVISVRNGLTWEIDNTKFEMVPLPPGYTPRPNW